MKRNKHLTDLRATAPAAIEDISEDAWREFQALQNSRQAQFQPTQPMSDLALLAGGEPSARPAASMTLDDAVRLARLNNRVCPLPARWKAMFHLMQSMAPPHAVPPVVIDGASWNLVPAMQKRLRLREQLEWAERLDVLAPTLQFLQSLPEDDWLHF